MSERRKQRYAWATLAVLSVLSLLVLLAGSGWSLLLVPVPVFALMWAVTKIRQLQPRRRRIVED